MAGMQTFKKSTLTDIQVCDAVFRGCNRGSGSEFKWFLDKPTFRSVRPGDVITVVRGDGDTRTSYVCKPQSWGKLDAIITSEGLYESSGAIPQLWTNNEAFVSAAAQLRSAIVAILDLGLNNSPDTSKRLISLAASLVEYTAPTTPQALWLVVHTVHRGLNSLLEEDMTEASIKDLLQIADEALDKVIAFTKMRMTGSPVREVVSAMEQSAGV